MKTQIKNLLLMAVLCLCFNCLKAQYVVNGIEIDTAFNTKMNHIFGNLDKSKVPYGILKDYGMEFTSLQSYDGTYMADSTLLNKNLLYEIYKTLFTAAVTSAAYTTLPNPDVTDSLWYTKRKPGQIALCGLFYQYAYLNANALAGGKITVSNEQYFDKYTSGVWQNPYLSGNTLGFAPATEVYMGKSFNILLADSLWLSNSKSIVNHIEVDAADGLGYRTLTPNTPMAVNYADTGLKIWNFKLYLTNSTILQSHTRLKVNADVYGQNVIAANSSSGSGGFATQGVVQGPPPNGSTAASAFYYVQSSETYGGRAAYGYATVQYAPGRTTIQKPLIVVEGFDNGHYTKPEILTGSYSLADFNNILVDSKSGDLKTLLTGAASEFDIIFVDYFDGTDDIRRNALLVKEVIRWVNSVKQPLGGTALQKNVVLGLSMGGVVARYALKSMENANETHDTRLYISHDSPQQGANVPTGLQYFENHAKNLYMRAGIGAALYNFITMFSSTQNTIPGTLDLNYTPASMQLLKNHINNSDGIDNTVHDQWQTELTNLGYPSQGGIRIVAISNGSECGQLQAWHGGDQMFLIDGEFKTSWITDVVVPMLVGVAAVPVTAAVLTGQPAFLLGILPGNNKINLHFQLNYSNTYGGNQVYNGHMSYTKKLLWLLPITVTMTDRSRDAPSGYLAFDCMGGGISDTEKPDDRSAKTWFYDHHITFSGPIDFGYIPTASALDISTSPTNLALADYLAPYSEGIPPVSPKNTPFANFVTAHNGNGNNEFHVSYETRNGDWLAKELKADGTSTNPYPLADCALLCQQTTITGQAVVCTNTSSQYSVPASAGVTYVWAVSSGLQITSGQNTNAIQILSTGSNQTATITCTYGNSNCGSATVNRTIIIGSLLPVITGIMPYTHYLGGQTLYLSATTQSPDIISWHWDVYGATIISGQGTPNIIILTAPANNNALLYLDVSVATTNACGVGPYAAVHAYVDPDANPEPVSIKTYPNPTDKAVTVSITTKKTGMVNPVSTPIPFSYKLYDKLGKIVRSGQSNGDDVSLNIDDLASNIYFMHLYVGDQIIKKTNYRAALMPLYSQQPLNNKQPPFKIKKAPVYRIFI